MLSSTALLLLSLPSIILSSPLTPTPQSSQIKTPSLTNADGTTNPYFPCGTTAAEIAACPYRCFDASTGSLLPSCYTASSANAAITSLQSVCVQCVLPTEPSDQAADSVCQPLTNYFDGLAPSRCGTATQFLANCAYNCAAAQVPFRMCDVQDSSGDLRVCEKCKPQCSSPRIVFQPAAEELPGNFSLSTGSCGTQYGQQQLVACPWRCKDVGNENSYCALSDVSVDGAGFTQCERC